MRWINASAARRVISRSFAIEAFERPSAIILKISAWLAVTVIFSPDATKLV